MKKLILIFLLFAACVDSGEITIPEDKLEAIILDLHLAEASIKSQDDEKQDSFRNVYIKQISEIHDIEEGELTRNLKILFENKEDFLSVYDSVVNHLDRLEETFYNLEDHEQ